MAGLIRDVRRSLRRAEEACRHAIVTRSPDWARRALGPTASYVDMLFVDHGVFRLVYVNKHKLSEKAWRAAQPAPHQIAAWSRDGIRTIVNLRGPRVCGSYWLEEQACLRHGIKLENFKVRSRAAPSLEELRGARELFGRIQYPMLMHCKSGADRAGLMSVLYLHLVEGLPIAEAKRALSLRYGHIRQADTGVLDYFFERYLAYNEQRPTAFYDWVETAYDPKDVESTFKAKGWANRIVNSVLRRE